MMTTLIDSIREQVIAEYSAMGLDARVEIDNFDTLTAEQLSDELTYLSDFQG